MVKGSVQQYHTNIIDRESFGTTEVKNQQKFSLESGTNLTLTVDEVTTLKFLKRNNVWTEISSISNVK